LVRRRDDGALLRLLLPALRILAASGGLSLRTTYIDEKVENRNVRGFRWEIAHAAVS
jgi:hypothetical protein